MVKLKRPSAVMGIFAFGLEATGVASGAYAYSSLFPVKLLGVPLIIPALWVLVMKLAYAVSRKYGVGVGVAAAIALDLVLEPLAAATGAWVWLNPYTTQIYFGSTIGNLVIWCGMAYLGIKLWKK